MPPQLMCIVPENAGGFGNVKEASEVFVRNELIPLQRRMQELNDWMGDEVVSFDEYRLNVESAS
ncbi:capsid portal protein [Serratia marcescens]